MYHNQLVIKGKIILESPMHIGSGEYETNDKLGDKGGEVQLIVKDKDGLPYIPASTLKGVLRRLCPKDLQAELFGCAKEDNKGNIGAIYFSNCFIEKRDSYASLVKNQPHAGGEGGKPVYISSRTKINRKTGTADRGDGEGGKLFNFEMVPAGLSFNFAWPVLNATEACKKNITQFLSLISSEDGFNLGRSTSTGHGLCKIPAEEMEIIAISVSGQEKSEAFMRLPVDQIKNSYHEKWACHYELRLDGLGPFLSINHDVERENKSNDPQIIPMRDQSEKPLLLPTSIKGVLRKRAAWIDQQICEEPSDDPDEDSFNDYKAEEITNLTPTQRLFGVSGWRGLLEIEAVNCLEEGTELDHTSVAIDRFTGGSLRHALFKTRCFVKPSFRVKLRLRKAVTENEEFSFPNEADRKLLSALIADMEENGVQLGHGISKGFGWFNVILGNGDKGAGLDNYFSHKKIEKVEFTAAPQISEEEKNRIIQQIKGSEDRAPYNFVHIENEVVAAPSGNGDCHDKPEKNRVSGVLDMRYIVETPLLIGGSKDINGYTQSVRLGDNGDYAIPGSSLKGMIRSIYEIATFSGIGFMNEGKLTYRDMSTGSGYLGIIKDTKDDFHGGWLKKENGEWKITEAEWRRIKISDIIGNSKTKNISEWLGMNLEKKHVFLEKKQWATNFKVACPERLEKDEKGNLSVSKVKIKTCGSVKATKATIVCSGKTTTGNKTTESVFFPIKDMESCNIDQSVMKRFLVAYGEPGTNGETPGEYLEYWLNKHNRSMADNDIPPIPVFFKGASRNIQEMGMTRLMKISYKNSIENYLPYPQSNKRDFTQTIFGYVDKEDDSDKAKTEALASRIQFGWASLRKADRLKSDDFIRKTTVAMSPRPTFWPYYLKLKTPLKNNPATMDYNSSPSDTMLAGRKRYPVHGLFKDLPLSPESKTENKIESKLEFIRGQQNKPLRFEGQIRFHNLDPVEFGALIWAITLGRSPHLRHSIGHSKAYGYGQMKTEILSAKLISSKATNLEGVNIDNYVDQFEEYMEKNTENDWRQSKSIQSLLNMTNPNIGKELGDKLSYIGDHTDYAKVKEDNTGDGLPEFV